MLIFLFSACNITFQIHMIASWKTWKEVSESFSSKTPTWAQKIKFEGRSKKKSTPAAGDLKFEALNLPLDPHPWGSRDSPFSTIVSAPPDVWRVPSRQRVFTMGARTVLSSTPDAVAAWRRPYLAQ